MTLEIIVLGITTTFVERCFLYCRLFGAEIDKRNCQLHLYTYIHVIDSLIIEQQLYRNVVLIYVITNIKFAFKFTIHSKRVQQYMNLAT